jgi:hypothetical protein
VAALSGAVGCTSGASSGSANLVGANAQVFAGTLLFLTSSETNELRVLNFNPPNSAVGARLWVRGPNPLETLSIPVLDRPTSLGIDHVFNEDGSETIGSWVYASRAGGDQISIVDIDLTVGLRELRRLTMPAPVSLTAGWTLPGISRLYVATYDGTDGALYAIDLPQTRDGLRALSAGLAVPFATLGARVRLVTSLPGETVTSLLVEGGVTGRTVDGASFCATQGEECLVLATRDNQGSGRTVMLDPTSLRTTSLAFGAPVKFLTTHGKNDVAATGQRVFAALDETACGSSDCGGVLAVDTLTGSAGAFHIMNDVSGYPMVPIGLGDAVVNGLAVHAGASLYVPAALFDGVQAGIKLYDALGVAVGSNSDLLFFDATTMEQLDTDSASPVVNTAVYADSAGNSQSWINGPQYDQITFADGAWRAQNLVAVWQGVVPGVAQLGTSDAEGTTLQVPSTVIDRVMVGDFVVFSSVAGACDDATVTAVGAASITVDHLPCTGRLTFSVRGGPRAPFVVSSTLNGYLGRAAEGGVLKYYGPYLFHIPSTQIDNGYRPGEPTLVLPFGIDTETSQPQRGASWTLAIDGHFAPYASIVDPTTCATSTTFPTGALFEAYDTIPHVMVLYPSAPGVVEVNPSLTGRGTIGSSSGTYCYH